MKNDTAICVKADSAASDVLHTATTFQYGFYRSFGKRIIDILLVISAVPFLLPILACLAALILVAEGKPFYSQSRVGLHGRAFRMWKFRTMVPDADSKLQAYLDAHPEMREEWDTHQKLTNDPRITPCGRLMRKTSLDELPQLWNVLIGDMSLVGPRPMMVEQNSLYPGTAYYRMRPGVTGPWQVSDRNDVSFSSRAGFDAEYEQKVSLLYDFWLVISTVRVVLRATGK